MSKALFVVALISLVGLAVNISLAEVSDEDLIRCERISPTKHSREVCHACCGRLGVNGEILYFTKGLCQCGSLRLSSVFRRQFDQEWERLLQDDSELKEMIEKPISELEEKNGPTVKNQ